MLCNPLPFIITKINNSVALIRVDEADVMAGLTIRLCMLLLKLYLKALQMPSQMMKQRCVDLICGLGAVRSTIPRAESVPEHDSVG